jgi:hypothetical protein
MLIAFHDFQHLQFAQPGCAARPKYAVADAVGTLDAVSMVKEKSIFQNQPIPSLGALVGIVLINFHDKGLDPSAHAGPPNHPCVLCLKMFK